MSTRQQFELKMHDLGSPRQPCSESLPEGAETGAIDLATPLSTLSRLSQRLYVHNDHTVSCMVAFYGCPIDCEGLCRFTLVPSISFL